MFCLTCILIETTKARGFEFGVRVLQGNYIDGNYNAGIRV